MVKPSYLYLFWENHLLSILQLKITKMSLLIIEMYSKTDYIYLILVLHTKYLSNTLSKKKLLWF